MTKPPKTMEEIRDAEAKKYHGWGTSANQAYKYGWDARDKMDNEALKIAVEALGKTVNYLHWREDDLIGDDIKGDNRLTIRFKEQVKIIYEALAETRKLRGEG